MRFDVHHHIHSVDCEAKTLARLDALEKLMSALKDGQDAIVAALTTANASMDALITKITADHTTEQAAIDALKAQLAALPSGDVPTPEELATQQTILASIVALQAKADAVNLNNPAVLPTS